MAAGGDWGPDEIAGDEIRLMWDYGVVVPLWDAHALLPDEPEWLRRVLRLSDTLIDELTRWARPWRCETGSHTSSRRSGGKQVKSFVGKDKTWRILFIGKSEAGTG